MNNSVIEKAEPLFSRSRTSFKSQLCVCVVHSELLSLNSYAHSLWNVFTISSPLFVQPMRNVIDWIQILFSINMIGYLSEWKRTSQQGSCFERGKVRKRSLWEMWHPNIFHCRLWFRSSKARFFAQSTSIASLNIATSNHLNAYTLLLTLLPHTAATIWGS